MQHAASAVFISLIVAACGHKGDPQPPAHPLPPAIADFAIERTAADVTLRFAVPDPRGDEDAPRLFERVEVYALTKLASEPAPIPIELVTSAHRVAAVNAPVMAKTGADQPPPAGDGVAAMMFKDTPAASAADAATVRYYAVQAAAGKRRGPLSPILKVPLGPIPAPPANVAAHYDQRVLSLSWTPAPAVQAFLIDDTDAEGGHATRLTVAPLETPAYETSVEFGKARCFVVRAIQKAFAVTVVGEAAAPVCVTPVDRFPPAAPTDLVALPADTGVELAWTASAATDLAGYIVLRAEGANGTLQPLTPQPIAELTYRDATARAGITYQYAIKAVDRAGNESAVSNRYTVTAR